MVLLAATCGWLCVFRTNMVVTWQRESYEKSTLAKGLGLKPFSSTFISWLGIVVCLSALVDICYMIAGNLP